MCGCGCAARPAVSLSSTWMSGPPQRQPNGKSHAGGVGHNAKDIRMTILFDTGGDDEPGGTFVDLLDVDLNGPHASFGNRCAIASDLIG